MRHGSCIVHNNRRAAEHDTLYTTLDILLAPTISIGDGAHSRSVRPNQLVTELGEHRYNVLLDFFVWPYPNPNLRNKLAHGALDPQPGSLPIEFALEVAALAIGLAVAYDPLRYTSNGSLVGCRNYSARGCAFALEWLDSHSLRYHPYALLQNELSNLRDILPPLTMHEARPTGIAMRQPSGELGATICSAGVMISPENQERCLHETESIREDMIQPPIDHSTRAAIKS